MPASPDPSRRQCEAERWDTRYAAEQDSWLERSPRSLLLAYAHLLPTQGRALDAAAGVSASGLFLAQRGMHVIALDISMVALRMGLQRARRQGLNLAAAVYDLSDPWFPPACFDVILNFYFLERATFHEYQKALKPGGLLFFETYVRRNEINDPGYYLETGELLQAFRDDDILYWEEKDVPGTEHHPERAIARLVARKPLA